MTRMTTAAAPLPGNLSPPQSRALRSNGGFRHGKYLQPRQVRHRTDDPEIACSSLLEVLFRRCLMDTDTRGFHVKASNTDAWRASGRHWLPIGEFHAWL
jgi:hypothetical protein